MFKLNNTRNILRFFFDVGNQNPFDMFFFNEENKQKPSVICFFCGKNNENQGSLDKCFSLEKQEKTMVKNHFVFLLGKQTKTHSSYKSIMASLQTNASIIL
jgi:hypothetical protein